MLTPALALLVLTTLVYELKLTCNVQVPDVWEAATLAEQTSLAAM